jgi:hypothetical protein
MSEGRSSAGRAALLTLLFCLFWAGAMLWPALEAPRERIVMDIGDPVLNASILAWNARTVPLTREWWNFPAFAPAPGVTAFTEHLLGFYPVATPLMWLTQHPVLAYNLLCLFSFPLTALGMFALARRLTGSSVAAFVGALAFTFAPFRVSHLSHVQMLWTFGIPMAVLGLHQWVDTRERRGLALFAAGWLVTAASNGYLMVFFGIYLLFWIAWFCTTREKVDRIAAIAATGAVATLPLLPILLGYVDVHREYGLRRPIAEIASFGADLTGIVRPWAGARFVWPWLEPTVGESAIFPGLGVLVLAIAGVAGRGRVQAAGRPRPRWVSRALLAAAVLFLAAASVAAVTNVRYDLGFARVSISNPGKPLTIGVVALLAAIAVNPRVDAVLRARSPALFHALMVPILWVLSLGPVGRVNGTEVVAGLPYGWLLDVPGMMTLRVPARLWLLATFSLAVLAAYGVALLTQRDATANASRRVWAGRFVVAVSVVLMLAEGWATVPGDPVAPFPVVVPTEAARGPLFELPFDRVDQNTVAVLRAVTGRYRVVNGYSGFEPPHFAPLRSGIRLRDSAVLDELQRWTPFHVSVASDDTDGLRTWLTQAQRDATLVVEAGGRALYALPQVERPRPQGTAPQVSPGSGLPFTIARASCGHTLLPDLHDGSLVTRWECGRGHPGQFIEADLGANRAVAGVVTSLGAYATDAPRSLRIALSPDANRWTTAWEGPLAALALRAAFENPRRMDVHIRFERVNARYVRITQTGEETESFWSVAELTIVANE